jgi:hypothetical protein
MGTLAAAIRLNASLEEVAAALAAPDADRLLLAEAGLASALDALGNTGSVAGDERRQLAAEVARARAALTRCRILGAALADAARIALAAQGHASDYDRSGGRSRAVPPSARGHHLQARL